MSTQHRSKPVADSTGANTENIRVVGLPRYPEQGASSRLRFYDLEKVFSAAGPVTYEPFFTNSHVKRVGQSGGLTRAIKAASVIAAYARRISFLVSLGLSKKAKNTVLILQIEALPNIPAAVELLFLRIARPKKVIVDLDDANHEVYRAMSSPLAKRLLGSKLEKIWSYADEVVAGSPVLADEVSKHVSSRTRVTLIPTVLQPQRYTLRDHSDKRDTIVVGWIGSPSTAKHLEHVIPALEEVAKTIPVELVVVGALVAPETTVPARRIEWSLEAETEAAANFDIGIMPLEDSLFARGKCGYKLLQYMAAGVPVIASDVGVNRHIVEGGPFSSGLIADSVGQWTEAIGQLAGNRVLRQELGNAGRDRVVNSYSIEAISDQWLKTLTSGSAAAVSESSK